MKSLKIFSTFLIAGLMTLTSCQDEIDNENGENPNTNSTNSLTASNLERTSMYDGSFDDFLDGISCASIVLPVTATVNDTQITIINESDYVQVLNILAQFNDDDDTVILQFPFTVQLSNYTEVVITNQTELEELEDACEEAESQMEDAISCIDIDYPITILTYSLNFEQTGSVVIESEEEMYSYITTFGDNELFSISYPITITTASGNTVTIESDADLQASIEDCLENEEIEDDADEAGNELEGILVDGTFYVETFVNNSVDIANDYAEYSIDFANDLTCTAENTINTSIENVQGTYEVTTDTNVFLTFNFNGNTSFNLLNQTWEVTSFSNSTIELQSTTNAAITLVLSQI